MSLWIDQKYVGLASIRLERFKKKSDKLYNFRCPFCGDSQKDRKKARGFLYVSKDRVGYKCHNCGISTSMGKFLSHVDPQLASQYRVETFSSVKAANTEQFLFKNEAPVQVIQPKEVLDEIGFVPLSNMPRCSHAVEYALSRKIPLEKFHDLYYAQDFSKIVAIAPQYENRIVAEERLVIPFRDKKGNLTGVSARAMNASTKFRYMSIRLSDVPMIYGMEKVDVTKVVYVIEGAIDSMFVENSVAVGGSDLARALSMFNMRNIVLVFDNEPRNKDIVKIMEKMVGRDHKMVIWPKSWTYKDINEAIVRGVSQEHVMETIRKHTYSGLSLKLAIRDWKK